MTRLIITVITFDKHIQCKIRLLNKSFSLSADGTFHINAVRQHYANLNDNIGNVKECQ